MKYLVPFNDITNWERTDKCEICKQIDQLTLTILYQEYLAYLQLNKRRASNHNEIAALNKELEALQSELLPSVSASNLSVQNVTSIDNINQIKVQKLVKSDNIPIKSTQAQLPVLISEQQKLRKRSMPISHIEKVKTDKSEIKAIVKQGLNPALIKAINNGTVGHIKLSDRYNHSKTEIESKLSPQQVKVKQGLGTIIDVTDTIVEAKENVQDDIEENTQIDIDTNNVNENGDHIKEIELRIKEIEGQIKQLSISNPYDDEQFCEDCKKIEENIKIIEMLQIDGYKVFNTLSKVTDMEDRHSRMLALRPMKTAVDDVTLRHEAFIEKLNNANSSITSANELLSTLNVDTGSDENTVLSSRWCRQCGRRKLDIYDSQRDLVSPITNFFCQLKDNTVSITWRDSSSSQYSYSKLFANDKELTSATYNQYESSPFTYEIDNNILYPFYVVNYNQFNEPITTSRIRYVLKEKKLEPLPAIDDLSSSQEVRLLPELLVRKLQAKEIILNQNFFKMLQDSTKLRKYIDKYVYDKDVDLDEPFQVNYTKRNIDIKKELPIKWLSQNMIITNFTPVSEETILRRSLKERGIPQIPKFNLAIDSKNDIRSVNDREKIGYASDTQFNQIARSGDKGVFSNSIACDQYQLMDNNDTRSWYIKPFPKSQIYAKYVNHSFIYYNDYNMNSNFALVDLKRLTSPCLDIHNEDGVNSTKLTWQDPALNWQSSLVYCKEYDSLPIQSIHDGQLVYESNIDCKHTIEPYLLTNLENGKYYQIGVFPKTKEGLIVVTPNQVVAHPLYLVDDQIVDKFVYNGLFTYDDHFHTDSETTAWFESTAPILEGGELTFAYECNYPIELNVYINREKVTLTNNIFERTPVSIKIEKTQYCKIVIELKSKYKTIDFNMYDLKLKYYSGDE